ncbi:bifunctional 2-C-methyl-D-erythritol 4-phosphate cytidylyltransferase/2-C-methyl-D-erythritol 2,4-cyclodiphosphate synthase [Novosphingobium sp. JCM 18896]|uniref:bifunctional 2-C-methyl-D-erythritol 4-phosphate cytidylyltransferase/2-C-methyl-D-erythritol 2,4-cyclodiphosphate synthase n=1 Tax=Novosphingobium sp. JCM 18896 TaxID=2989731 RepID=UPI002221EB7C|nr:bifunctional 2-C-methyl-D-erythritol 4-phosphate cytidylyltransferase/2-C-methyl-D-erythritol 2,4-cyclodiphosphate synthase [Novosphingobium sp. JCM 18896]MCW1428481.1 bifunctional 2-C-methyl-D-erythritol 4-phosphate cytidylyltransferase/2-C-methyl-D-erythritol 2,4-cyclodiphosphate synthase [Novosphingobium sp. JCM 18896]
MSASDTTSPAAPPRTAAIVVAAGAGLRAGQPLPKQFAPWRGKPVVRHSVEALIAAKVSPVVVMIPERAEDLAGKALSGLDVRLVTGGQTRQDSVRRGLEALTAEAPDLVLIHDAARPVLKPLVIERLQAALVEHAGAIPVLSVVDSLAHASGTMMGQPADRTALRRVQTPQAFHYPVILAAHRSWTGTSDAGDDAQVAQAAGIEIALVEGDEALHKLTFASDFPTNLPPVRIGTGYDVHQLADGEELWLNGIRIDHHQGLAGHSDADVAIHALVDALLGAIGAGDIGQHFPPSDPQWRGASSDRFLAHAVSLVGEAGYAVGNVDVTIICEAPKIGPHREAMRARLAELLGVDIGAVSVKATTTEKLGFTGRGEGIAAQAAACLVRMEG